MVSPVPDERDTKKIKRFTHYGLAHQPVDLREGVAKAYTVVKEVKKKKRSRICMIPMKIIFSLMVFSCNAPISRGSQTQR